MHLVIEIPREDYERLKEYEEAPFNSLTARIYVAIANGTPLREGHGRIGDLSELETRISNFIEYHKSLLEETDPRALVFMNSILDGIRETDTLIEAESEDSLCGKQH